MATKAATFPRLAQVQDSIRNLQSEGEKLLTRIRKEAGKLVSKDQRKAIDNLISQAKAIRNDIQKRSEKAIKMLESRAEKLYAQIEAQTKKRIDPLVRRLSLPTKHEVEQLAKRLSSLEKKVGDLLDSKSRAA
jgi:poly(hydroxyalkanoate) granule-associated protein